MQYFMRKNKLMCQSQEEGLPKDFSEAKRNLCFCGTGQKGRKIFRPFFATAFAVLPSQ
jgi:hypothetical protein